MTSFFFDVDKYNAWASRKLRGIGAKFPGEHDYNIEYLPRYGIDTEGTVELSVDGKNNFLSNCVALNGFWVEVIHMRQINGKWLQARMVKWRDAKIEGANTVFADRTVLQYADNGYPHKATAEIDWDY